MRPHVALGAARTTLPEMDNGKRGISPEIAVRLSNVFGGTPESWLTQQAHYGLAHLRTSPLKLKRLQFAEPSHSRLLEACNYVFALNQAESC